MGFCLLPRAYRLVRGDVPCPNASPIMSTGTMRASERDSYVVLFAMGRRRAGAQPNPPVEQVPLVAVAVTEHDAERVALGRPVVHCDHDERDGLPVVPALPNDGQAVRRVIE